VTGPAAAPTGTEAQAYPAERVEAGDLPRASAATSSSAPLTDEARLATAPTPSDIRARAEEVRQRALAARAARDEGHRAPSLTIDEPALFDIDEASLDPHRAAPAPDPMAGEQPAPAPAGRGLFTINKLIHRVAGSRAAQKPPSGRREPPTPELEDDGRELPAFLRRQVN